MDLSCSVKTRIRVPHAVVKDVMPFAFKNVLKDAFQQRVGGGTCAPTPSPLRGSVRRCGGPTRLRVRAWRSWRRWGESFPRSFWIIKSTLLNATWYNRPRGSGRFVPGATRCGGQRDG